MDCNACARCHRVLLLAWPRSNVEAGCVGNRTLGRCCTFLASGPSEVIELRLGLWDERSPRAWRCLTKLRRMSVAFPGKVHFGQSGRLSSLYRAYVKVAARPKQQGTVRIVQPCGPPGLHCTWVPMYRLRYPMSSSHFSCPIWTSTHRCEGSCSSVAD